MAALGGGTKRTTDSRWPIRKNRISQKAVTKTQQVFCSRAGRRPSPPTSLMENLRGYDRRPTEEEALGPPDQCPWTEYDGHGDKQSKPPFKALSFGPLCCFGPTCCVFELQWPEWLCD